jgi:predicted kinase
MKILEICYGLSCSGKTSFAKTQSGLVIHGDDFIQNGKIDHSTIAEMIRLYEGSKVTLDTLVTTNKTLEEILRLLDTDRKIRVLVFDVDREILLERNSLRTERGSCEASIRNMPFEIPNLWEVEVVIMREDYDVFLSNLKRFCSVNDSSHNPDVKIIRGDSWCLGGTWGDCWGGSGITPAGSRPSFDVLDMFLTSRYPNMSYLQYKALFNNLIETHTYGYGDYYGGYVEYSYEYVRVEDFYRKMVEMELL